MRTRGWVQVPIRRIVGGQLIDRGTLGILALIVNVVVARTLGVEAMGNLATAMALTALGSAIAIVGIDASLPRLLIGGHFSDAELLGSAIMVRRIAGALAGVLTVAAAYLLYRDHSPVPLLTVALCLAWLFPGGEVLESYWITHGRVRRYLGAKACAAVTGAAARTFAAIGAGSTIAVAAAAPLEAAMREGLQRIGLRAAIGGPLYASRAAARALVERNTPLIFATLAVIGYHRLDQLMLSRIIGAEAAGIYATAVQIIELGFAAMMILSKAWTGRLTAAATQADRGFASLAVALRQAAALGAVAALALWWLAPWIIGLLYGPAFMSAAPILSWLGLSLLFVGLGTVSSIWLVARGLERLALRRTLLGLATNVVLNVLLIPRWGAQGAAVATVASQMLACWLADLTDPETRTVFRIKAAAMNPLSGKGLR